MNFIKDYKFYISNLKTEIQAGWVYYWKNNGTHFFMDLLLLIYWKTVIGKDFKDLSTTINFRKRTYKID
jgi:hypothetical protein